MTYDSSRGRWQWAFSEKAQSHWVTEQWRERSVPAKSNQEWGDSRNHLDNRRNSKDCVVTLVILLEELIIPWGPKSPRVATMPEKYSMGRLPTGRGATDDILKVAGICCIRSARNWSFIVANLGERLCQAVNIYSVILFTDYIVLKICMRNTIV